MTIEQLLEKYKRKYPGVPYEIEDDYYVVSKKNGKEHSYNDAPAIIYTSGTEEWYKEGKRHRENDKPAVIYPDGKKAWYFEGKLHRENDKPAIFYPIGTRFYPDGVKKYYYHGKKYTPTESTKKRIERLTTKKSSKQKQREDLLKEFVSEMLNT